MYSRVLLKISGEMFAGDREHEHGIDANWVDWLAKEIKDTIDCTNIELAIVVGGGNFMRGKSLEDQDKSGVIERATADYIGMLATVMNGVALVDGLKKNEVSATLFSKIEVESIADNFRRRKALSSLAKGRVIVLTGGAGMPYMTTDTISVLAALELNCDLILKATKVDGIYDSDPKINAKAKKLNNLTHQEALTNPNISVMDDAAIALAKENKLEIKVFNLSSGNIKKAISGDEIGTLVKSN